MESILATKINTLLPLLDERQARLYLALEANAYGRGGVKLVHEISGVSQTTIIRGKKELEEGITLEVGRVRKPGGGRRKLTQKYDDIKDAIERIVADKTYGNPENPLTWTTRSLRNITEQMVEAGYEINTNLRSNSYWHMPSIE